MSHNVAHMLLVSIGAKYECDGELIDQDRAASSRAAFDFLIHKALTLERFDIYSILIIAISYIAVAIIYE